MYAIASRPNGSEYEVKILPGLVRMPPDHSKDLSYKNDDYGYGDQSYGNKDYQRDLQEIKAMMLRIYDSVM